MAIEKRNPALCVIICVPDKGILDKAMISKKFKPQITQLSLLKEYVEALFTFSRASEKNVFFEGSSS